MCLSKNRRQRGLWLPVLLAAGMWGTVLSPALATSIPWKEETFTSRVQDQDVKDLLTELFRRNGQDVVFLPGVEGEITFVFNETLFQVSPKYQKFPKYPPGRPM